MNDYYDYHPLHRLSRPLALVSFVNRLTRSVASSLASLSGLPLVLLDERVEHQLGASSEEVVAQRGLPAFRRQEKDELVKALRARPMGVIALGDGALRDGASLALALDQAEVVYLHLAFEQARERARRQSFNQKAALMADVLGRESDENDAFESVFAERAVGYARAHSTIDASRHTVKELVALLGDRLSKAGP